METVDEAGRLALNPATKSDFCRGKQPTSVRQLDNSCECNGIDPPRRTRLKFAMENYHSGTTYLPRINQRPSQLSLSVPACCSHHRQTSAHYIDFQTPSFGKEFSVLALIAAIVAKHPSLSLDDTFSVWFNVLHPSLHCLHAMPVYLATCDASECEPSWLEHELHHIASQTSMGGMAWVECLRQLALPDPLLPPPLPL